MQRTLIHGISIGHIQVQGAGHRLTRTHGLTHHHNRVANPDLSMHNGPIRLGHTVDLLRGKALFQEIDQPGYPGHNQEWRDTVKTVGNGLDCHS